MKNPRVFTVRRRPKSKANFPEEIFARVYTAHYRRRRRRPGSHTEVESFTRIGDADNGERIAIYRLVRIGTVEKKTTLK